MSIDAVNNHNSIDYVSEVVNGGQISAREICETALNNAEKDICGSFITVTRREAISAADRVDKAISNGIRLPLAGITLAVKDNICTAGIRTTCASAALEYFVPSYDATAYERLIAAGCVPIGKTNMDEFAMGSEGSLSHFGITRNPLNPDLIAGGSSSGSAAAVSAKIASVSLGSDTGGSSRQPAGLCALVSMKPTYGRISRQGLVEFAPSMDQICPITHTVKENAMIISVMEGADFKDLSMRRDLDMINPTPESKIPERMGVFIPTGCSAAVVNAVRKASMLFSESGSECEPAELPEQSYAVCVYNALSSVEALSCLARYDGMKYKSADLSSVKDISSAREIRGQCFGKEVKERLALGAAALSVNDAALYRTAVDLRKKIAVETDALFEKYKVIIMPTTKRTSYRFGQYYNEDDADLNLVYANLTGCPAISVPFAGASVQLMAARGEDNALYSAAKFLEDNNS